MIDHRGPQLNYVTEPSEDLVTSSAHLVSLRRFVCAQGKNEAVSAQQVALVMCTFKNELVSTALSSLLKCRSFLPQKFSSLDGELGNEVKFLDQKTLRHHSFFLTRWRGKERVFYAMPVYFQRPENALKRANGMYLFSTLREGFSILCASCSKGS